MLLRDYNSQASIFDEMRGFGDAIRSPWKSYFDNFNKFTAEEFENRYAELLRLLRENGVTYNIYNDPDGLNRPWLLDPIPLILSETEWSFIQKGLEERTYLLNLILEDIYGENRLIKEGILPYDLVYSHQGFLRCMVGVSNRKSQALPFYAADIVRGGGGKPWVLNDRTQAPSGIGYALENRSAISRVFHSFSKEYNIRRLATFFDSFRDLLIGMGPTNKENPKIVVLTPGPRNETFFEHSYLATFLGFTLVQGEDLTVRDHHVYIKSISGLEKVDVILRRVDDTFCDPLELREDSQLGVPGLVSAIRKGNVSVVNPLGSSFIENPALMAFLPNIAQYFLKKDLILPSVATWWCGQEKERNHVIDNIDKFIIKRVSRVNNKDSVNGALLSTLEKNDLIAEIRAYPQSFVGQEQVNFSTTPLYINKKIEPRFAVMRCYSINNGTKIETMAGGLTRCSPEEGLFIISNQTGGIAKDSWVLGNEEQVITKQKITQNATKISDSQSLPSRTAENLFWVGRYAERTLFVARLLRVILKNIDNVVGFNHDSGIISNQNFFRALTHSTMTYPGFVGEKSAEKLAKPNEEILDVILNVNKVGSLAFSLQQFIRACFAVKDQLALDTWRMTGNLEEILLSFNEMMNKNFELRQVQNQLENIITSLMAFVGLNNESMTRENAWLILDCGRKIEMSLMLTSFIRSTLVFKYDEYSEYEIQERVLSTNESLITYKYRNRTPINLQSVLDLLLLDKNNPRSLVFQIESLKHNLELLPKRSVTFQVTDEEKLVLEAYTKLLLADTQKLSNHVVKSIRKDLDELMALISKQLAETSNVICQKFFSHSFINNL